MKNKIISFIYNSKSNKFLILKIIKHPDHAPKGGWFVVTGEFEDNETHEEAVTREVKEETGLSVEEIFPLNWGSIYNWRRDICKEHNFLSFVKLGKINLNEEHSKYEWLDIKEFVKRIKWDDDKNLLSKVLENAINKDVYFEKFEIKDYREE